MEEWGEKGQKRGLLDAVVSHLIVEAGAADLKVFGCLYAVPLCVGKSLDDAAIWDIVAFLRQLPRMSPETYQELLKTHAP